MFLFVVLAVGLAVGAITLIFLSFYKVLELLPVAVLSGIFLYMGLSALTLLRTVSLEYFQVLLARFSRERIDCKVH